MKACAKVDATTDGDVFGRLVVTFFRRTPRCIMAAKVGVLLPMEEIGPDGKRSIGLPLLLTDGGTLSTCNTENELLMEIELKELTYRFGSTYSIIGNFVLRINHAVV